MTSKTSIKVSKKGVDFLKKLRTNRRKVETDNHDLAYWRLIDIIAKYFKDNNERYIDLIKVVEDNNV